MQQRTSRTLSVLGFFLTLTACFFVFVPPIPQDTFYHNFADQRDFWGIPNTFDVLTSLAFLIVGVWGLIFLWQNQSRIALQHKRELIFWILFFGGVSLVAFGSGYYHLNPTNETLVWDRYAIAFAIMAWFSYILYAHGENRFGFFALPVLILFGLGTVWYWDYTEAQGIGDLRPYAVAQFGPLILTPFLLYLNKGDYTGRRYLVGLLLWMVLAKITEATDGPIFQLSQGIISGHTLKHFASALGCFEMIRYLKHRTSNR